MINESQREARIHGIGGSDAPVIAGCSPYKHISELWLEKTGQAEPAVLDGVEPVEWGNRLEAVVADAFSERTGLKLRRRNQTLIDRSEPFLMANIDREVIGQRAVAEIKTVRGLADDAPRADHLVQLQHYMHVGDYQAGHLVYLVAGQRMVFFQIARDQEAIEALLEQERAFWRHVRDRTPPPARSGFDLRILFRQDTGGTVIADDSVQQAVQRLAEIRAQVKALEAQAEELEKPILEALGENSTLMADTGEVLATWKSSKPSRVFDSKRFQAENQDLAGQFMVERPGSRRFLLKVAA